jgi:four helix bundle protein
VWQAARDQCSRVGALIKRPEFRGDAEIARQMNDASISVMFNISEGFLRRRDPDTLNFLRYALASNGELKSGYYACEDRRHITAAEGAELRELNESIGRMLNRWKATLTPGLPQRKPGSTDQGGPRDQGRTKDQGPRTKD